MTPDLEARARAAAETLAKIADSRSRQLSIGQPDGVEVRAGASDAMAELAEIVRLLVAETSSQ